MVIGAAKFAIDSLGETDSIPVTSWVYPQTKAEGFKDFSNSKEILNFYIELFGCKPAVREQKWSDIRLARRLKCRKK